MELNWGTEPRGDCSGPELADATHWLVTGVRPLESGQEVLITAGPLADMRMVRATAGAAQVVGAVPTTVVYATQPGRMHSPRGPAAQAALGVVVPLAGAHGRGAARSIPVPRRRTDRGEGQYTHPEQAEFCRPMPALDY